MIGWAMNADGVLLDANGLVIANTREPRLAVASNRRPGAGGGGGAAQRVGMGTDWHHPPALGDPELAQRDRRQTADRVSTGR